MAPWTTNCAWLQWYLFPAYVCFSAAVLLMEVTVDPLMLPQDVKLYTHEVASLHNGPSMQPWQSAMAGAPHRAGACRASLFACASLKPSDVLLL